MDIFNELEQYFEQNSVEENLQNKVFKYYEAEEKDENLELEIIKQNIEKERIRLKRGKIDLSEVDTIVSFISMSRQKVEAFEKIMWLLDGQIKSLILVCTEKSREKIEKISKKYSNLDVVSMELEDPDNFNELYSKLQSHFIKCKIPLKNVVIDSTMGYKMVSFAFYKLGTELDIKIVNWRQEQMKHNFKFGSDIIVGSDRLKVMDSPKLENYSLYKDVNNLLENGEYKAASNLYKHIKNGSKSLFFNDLARLFNMNTIVDYELFRSRSRELIVNIKEAVKSMKYDECEMVWGTYVGVLNCSAESYGESIETDVLNFKKLNEKEKTDDNLIFVENQLQQFFLWRIMSLIYLKKLDIEKSLKEKIILDIMDMDYDYLSQINVVGLKVFDKAMKMTLNNGETFKEYFELCENFYISSRINYEFDEMILSGIDKAEKNEMIEIESYLLNLKEDIGEGVIFKNGNLYIPKYEIKISEDLVLKPNKNGSRIIKEIIKTCIERDSAIDKNEVKEIISNDYLENGKVDSCDVDDKLKGKVTKAYSRLTKIDIPGFNTGIMNKIDTDYSEISALEELPELIIVGKDFVKINKIYL